MAGLRLIRQGAVGAARRLSCEFLCYTICKQRDHKGSSGRACRCVHADAKLMELEGIR